MAILTDLRAQLQSALADVYTLQRELSGGGMSRVFVATENSLGRTVVVKVLPLEAGGALSVERFQREVTFAARLHHPHIVPLLSAGDAGGTPFFTMPYIEGESLRAYVARHGALSLADAVRILREIASALAHAHDAGVVHRDVKPDNVFIAGGSAVVSDFGIAKAVAASTIAPGEITTQGVSLGTPAYMAPEQVSGDPGIDHRADIYAWGVVAYELLAGTTPFAGRTAHEMMAAHLSEAPRSLATVRSDLPAPLAGLVMRALEKRPADRPQSAGDVIAALDAGSTPMAGPSLRRRTRGQKLPWIAAVVLIVGAILAGRKYSRVAAPRSSSGAIAVMPIDNATRDTAYDYLADGLTDEIHSQLTRVEGLTVRGQQSANTFRGRTADLAGIASSLNVANVVQGTLTLAAGRAHLAIDVVRVSDSASLWSGTFDPELRDFYPVRDSIAAAVARALTLRFGSVAHPQRAVDPAALELVLRGRFASSKSSETDYRQALRYFELALEKDPRLAEAYAGIAWTYTFLADAYVTPAIAYTEAERAARKALTIDSTNADAHLVLAMTHIFRDWNFTTAQAEFMRAMALNPQRAEAASTYAVALAWSGRTSEAVAEAERATAIDPLSLIALFQQAMILDIAGRYRDAIGVYRRLIAIEPRFFYLRSFDSWGYRGLGMLDSAYAAARRDVALDNGPVIDLALTLAGMHRTAEARAAIQIAEAGLRKTYYPPEFIALGYAAVDDPDQAFAWLERVFSTRSAFWMQLQYSREWKPMMADARWAAFLKRAEAARQ